jgi:hypothetical protein
MHIIRNEATRTPTSFFYLKCCIMGTEVQDIYNLFHKFYDSIVFRIRFKPLQKSLASLLWITQETSNRDSRDI